MGIVAGAIYMLNIYHLWSNMRPLDGPICQSDGFLVGTLAVGSMHQIAVICVEQCVHIVRPFWARRIRMWHKVGVIALVYLGAMLISLPPLLGWGSFTVEHHEWYCW